MESDNPCVNELVGRIIERLAVPRPFRATYRQQFTAEQFRFADAHALADYLADLGVSHVYAAPCLKARAGSTHGYDVVDQTRLNDELGTEEEYAQYVQALHERGLGQILDIVPNHMCVATDENAMWMDVLMHGQASQYAAWFDIDWQPSKKELEGKVLLPILGDLYGNVLESGELPVRYRDGGFFVRCGSSMLPLDPRTWVDLLTPHLDELAQQLSAESPSLLELQSIVTALQNLPERHETAPERVALRRNERIVVQGRIRRLTEESPQFTAHLLRNLEELNGTKGSPASFDALDRLLDKQAHRLVFWKSGSDELNYRRFFDVTELAAVCMENGDVFEAAHKLPFDLAVRGLVDGFRIDHIDGLFDPGQYLWRLQWGYLLALGWQEHAALASQGRELPDWSSLQTAVLEALQARFGGPEPQQSAFPGGRWPLFVLVEKILGVDEPIPPEWPVEGTTGYDYLNLVNGLFVEPAGLRQIERHYARFVELHDSLEEIVYDCKRLILSVPMQSEVQLLAHRLDRLSNHHRRSRDYTLQALRTALREIIACFPVYRSYVHDGFSDRDRRVIMQAFEQARRRNPAMSVRILEFVRDVLLLEQPQELDDAGRLERRLFIGRFQQVTSPVMAKGVEDTAFYRYVPLVSLEEVGGEPSHAVTPVEDYHRQNAARLKEWPRAMLASTTHDTKRTEDVRARIDVLTEVPEAWRSAVSRWSRWNRKHHREVDGQPAPSRNDEWLLYQTLVGYWPLTPPSPEERAVLIERMQQYLEKATHEAKLRTSWISPNPKYDEAVLEFAAAVLSDGESRFAQDFQAFLETVLDSGLYTAASQAFLKLSSPGIPDIYQGQELWDFSLVDPDNRRPVDFERRRRLLAELASRTQTPESRRQFARQLAANPRDDRLKLYLTRTALEFRSRCPDLLEAFDYVPLEVQGEKSAHACAFAWVSRGDGPRRTAIVVAPRLLQSLTGAGPGKPPCGSDVWKDTALVLNPLPNDGEWRDQFTGRHVSFSGGRLLLGELLEVFPMALLTAGL